jgi:CheY-like chemotaxis protein
MKSGPIIIIEDDPDDAGVLEEIFFELHIPNKLLWFLSSEDAIRYMHTATEQPFLILSDINMPGLNGIEFKQYIDGDLNLRRKCIPFIFYSTSADEQIVNKAYNELTVQGFFQKSGTYGEIKNMVRTIIDYWLLCRHPNSSYSHSPD